jgi:hypothetical protein
MAAGLLAAAAACVLLVFLAPAVSGQPALSISPIAKPSLF